MVQIPRREIAAKRHGLIAFNSSLPELAIESPQLWFVRRADGTIRLEAWCRAKRPRFGLLKDVVQTIAAQVTRGASLRDLAITNATLA